VAIASDAEVETHRFVDLVELLLKDAKLLELAESLGECDMRIDALRQNPLAGVCLFERLAHSENIVSDVLQYCACFCEMKMAVHRAIKVGQSKTFRVVITSPFSLRPPRNPLHRFVDLGSHV
jgi:hypothetical protein